MNTVIICHVHHLSTEMKGKNAQCLKAHLEILTKLLLLIYLPNVKDYCMI